MKKTENVRILVINTGSTSTKLAVFLDRELQFEQSLSYSKADLEPFESELAQLDMRRASVEAFVEQSGMSMADFDVIAARGGSFAVVEGGGYVIDDTILALASAPRPGFRASASWLAVLIAGELTKKYGLPSYFYNGVRTDEMCDLARYSGASFVRRRPAGHPLNCKEVGHRSAEKMGRRYEDCSFVICHLGGGISTEMHYKGRIVDVIGYPEGAFTPERMGVIPTDDVIRLCFSGKYTQKELERYLRGGGGLADYLGTTSAIEVEQRIESGDAKAEEVYRAMAYQIGKGIASLAATVKGDVDRILITGGIAYSELLTGWIRDYVGFIAPVEIYPGSFEMEALAHGILRIWREEEQARVYDK